MRAWHYYLMLVVAALGTFAALNAWPRVEVAADEVLPCINVGFDHRPAGFEDRIPGVVTCPRIRTARLADELPARPMYVERGWPLTFQKTSGFLYELEPKSTWFGVPHDFPSPLSVSAARSALAVNLLVALAPFAVVGMFVAARRWRVQQRTELPRQLD